MLAAYQLYFIWGSGLEETFFLEIDRSETRIACGGNIYKRIGSSLDRGHSIDDSHQVAVHFGQAVSEGKINRN
jgi:hypothetical protein